MDLRQTRLMTVMALVLVAVTAGLWFGESDDPKSSDADATAEVWTVVPETVTRVEIWRESGDLVLERTGDAWAMTSPETFAVDPARVQALLKPLAAIALGVPIEGGDPADFGLGGKPVARVRLGRADGTTAELAIGRESPVGFRTYAQVPGGGIIAVDGHPAEDLLADPNTFRDRRVATFTPESVRRVTLTGPEGSLSVHGEGKSWWLDGYTRAEPDAVDDLVTGILAMRFDEITGAPGAIGSPVRTVRVEANGEIWTLRVGADDSGGTPVEVERGLSGVVSSEALALLGMGPTDLGDSRVFPFDPEGTTRVEVVRGEKIYAIEDGAEGWLHDGKATPEAAEVGKAVNDAAIAYRRVPAPPIDTPWLSVVLKGGDRERRVDIGQIVDVDFRVAQDKDGGAPYLAPVAEIEALDRVVK